MYVRSDESETETRWLYCVKRVHVVIVLRRGPAPCTPELHAAVRAADVRAHVASRPKALAALITLKCTHTVVHAVDVPAEVVRVAEGLVALVASVLLHALVHYLGVRPEVAR